MYVQYCCESIAAHYRDCKEEGGGEDDPGTANRGLHCRRLSTEVCPPKNKGLQAMLKTVYSIGDCNELADATLFIHTH